eukprot:8950182-Heterocapsa_arctica.AAC.1
MPKANDFLPAHLLAASVDEGDHPRSATPSGRPASSGQRRPAEPAPAGSPDRTDATPGLGLTGHF